jgi:hypothetical protein
MTLSRSRAFLGGAWCQLPIETAVVALAAIGAIGMIHGDGGVGGVRLVLASLVVMPLAVATHRLGRARQLLVIGPVTGAVLAVLWRALPDSRALGLEAFTWPYALSLLAAMLVPFVASGHQLAGFVRRFFEQTTTWGLVWLCALGAIGVTTLTLRELFDLRIDRPSADVAVLVTGGFVLVYIDRMVAEDRASSGRMPELWRRLATAIGAPFVSVMLAILTCYELSAAVRGELPRNLLSPLIMAAGFVGFVSTLIIASVLIEAPTDAPLTPAIRHVWTRRWTVRLTRAFPLVLCALLPMACWALWRRVDEYGLTPFRAVRAHGLACLAVLSLVGAVRWFRGRPPLGWEVPAAVLVFALAAAFGPLSAVRISIASQSRALGQLLDRAGVGRDVALAGRPGIVVDNTAILQIRDSITVLARLGGEPALRGVLTGAVELCADRWGPPYACVHGLGLGQGDDRRPSSYVLAAVGRFETGPGQLALIELVRDWTEPTAAPTATRDLGLLADALAIYDGDVEVARVALDDLVATWRGDRVLPTRMVRVVRRDGSVLASLAVHRLEIAQRDDAPPQITRLTGTLVWPP